MIQTTNYLGREKGVRSGMPGFIGKKLEPKLVFVKPNYALYRQVSDQFKKILEEYDPDLESIGLDEASIDVTDFIRKNNLESQEGRIFLASKMRQQIKEATGLTASCGIACNRFLAKVACGVNKPDGSTYLGFNECEILQFLRDVPIRKVPGIGLMNEMILNGLGISNCGDIISKAPEIFVNFTENAFAFLMQCALGVSRCVHEQTVQKSISTSKTFSKFLVSWEEHCEKLSVLASELA
jgi:DNA polymerase kappa